MTEGDHVTAITTSGPHEARHERHLTHWQPDRTPEAVL
jgi:hypothetical protein